ncbi:TPA: beta-lactamase family protein [Pseudomonas aeruginosa]|nr:beta-lactamase family protein [Pseudomonas aeruginosa]
MFRAMHLPLLGCLIGASGCQGLPPSSPTTSADPEHYGEVIDYLQQHIRQQMKIQKIPGLALALVDDQQLIWARGFGYADVERRSNASEHTAFRVGGLSKLLTASASLQLAERGLLPLDSPLQDSLREFYVRSRFHADQGEADRAVTIRRLLSHQSGLPGDHMPDLFDDRPLPLAQLPAKVSGVWLSNPPGTQVAYSNLGYALLGAAIERSSGEDFEQHLQDSLLRPLQMSHSSFATHTRTEQHRARGYGATEDESRDLPANGLWASPADLSRFVRMLFADGRYKDRQLLRKQSVEEMFRQQNAGNVLDFDCQVGLAWFLTSCGTPPLENAGRHYAYAGSAAGFHAYLILAPEQRLAAIVMSNSAAAGSLTSSLARHALSLMLRVKQSGAPTPMTTTPSRSAGLAVPSPMDRQRLSGHYATSLGLVRLHERKGRLYADFGDQRVELLRNAAGWLQARKRLLGLWPVDLKEPGQPQLDVVSHGQRQILVCRRHGRTTYLGERIARTPLPQAWVDTVGSYRVSGNGGHSYLDGLSIRLADGFLLVRGRTGNGQLGEFILQPVDSAHAVLAGSGQGLGDTFSRDFDGLNALGYRFARQGAQASP